MKKSILIAGALMVLGAAAASAQGINLSWIDCGVAGQQNAAFACNSNTGNNSAIASFDPPAGVGRFIGISAQVDVTTDQAILTDWWKFGGTNCRTTALSVSFDFAGGPFSCADFFAGQASGGFAYNVGFGSAARARLLIQAAVEPALEGPIDAGTEYYAFKMNVGRAKTTGTGACTGCTNRACIVLNEIQLFQPLDAAFDPQIFNPRDRNYVTWQGPPATTPLCPESTPTQSKTWGQVKSLYR